MIANIEIMLIPIANVKLICGEYIPPCLFSQCAALVVAITNQ